MLLGSGQQLGLYPSPQFSLLFFVSPTGNYFKGNATGGLHLHLETLRCRAARGGVGNVKCAGNYAVALRPLMDAKKQGFHDNLYLELETYQPGHIQSAVLQEMSAANIFLVLKSGKIVTPSLDRGTLLPGVTRESVLAIVRADFQELSDCLLHFVPPSQLPPKIIVEERDVTVADLEEAAEVFCTGTAAELVPIARIATGQGEEPWERILPYGSQSAGPVTAQLLILLRKVMYGEIVLDKTWLKDPFDETVTFCQ
jgi:branched-chain amino acid aminotransferase